MTDVRQDVLFMKMALRQAEKGRGRTSPNPMVGAVVVKNGRVVGQGYHLKAGGPHAEVLALRKAGPRARGATLYVTLEPCCHSRKRTPPCVPLLIHSHLRRIVIAMRDPNPQVGGRGTGQLKRAGLDVEVGCMEREAQRLNEAYVHWTQTDRPFVILKSAMTLDGKIATASGESQWITGEAAQRHVHRLRSQVDAIMVGIGTILKDNPRLSARTTPGPHRTRNVPQPLRIILDSRLRIPSTANVLKWILEQPTVVVTTSQGSKSRIQQLQDRGVHVWILPTYKKRVSLVSCLNRLGKVGITNVLLEGGSELNANALRLKLVNRVMLYMAPRLLGGQDAKGLIGGKSPRRLIDATAAKDVDFQRVDQDMLISATLCY